MPRSHHHAAMVATFVASALVLTGCWASPRDCEDASRDCFGNEQCVQGQCVLASLTSQQPPNHNTTPTPSQDMGSSDMRGGADMSAPNNGAPNNVTTNNQTPNNQTPNNQTPNNVSPNNQTPNNQTPNNVSPNNNNTPASLAASTPRMALGQGVPLQGPWVSVAPGQFYMRASQSAAFQLDPGTSDPTLTFSLRADPATIYDTFYDDTGDETSIEGALMEIDISFAICLSNSPVNLTQGGLAALEQTCTFTSNALAEARSKINLYSAYESYSYDACSTSSCPDYDCQDYSFSPTVGAPTNITTSSPRYMTLIAIATYGGSVGETQLVGILDDLSSFTSTLRASATLRWDKGSLTQALDLTN